MKPGVFTLNGNICEEFQSPGIEPGSFCLQTVCTLALLPVSGNRFEQTSWPFSKNPSCLQFILNKLEILWIRTATALDRSFPSGPCQSWILAEGLIWQFFWIWHWFKWREYSSFNSFFYNLEWYINDLVFTRFPFSVWQTSILNTDWNFSTFH